MSPYREHQIDRPASWYAGAIAGLLAFVSIAWPFLVAAAILLLVTTSAWLVADAAETAQKERAASLATEARSWSTSVGFHVVGVYCYGDAVCDVSIGSAESMRVLYLHCVPGKWMAETGQWPKRKPVVHSANPVGRASMLATIERYLPR